jgi:hypothetical protein
MSSSSDEVFQFQKSPIPSHSRVVVTGVGFVTPCGIGQESLWDKVLQGVSATRSLTRIDLPPVCYSRLMRDMSRGVEYELRIHSVGA